MCNCDITELVFLSLIRVCVLQLAALCHTCLHVVISWKSLPVQLIL